MINQKIVNWSFQIWQLGSATPYCTLEGHEKGVNCVDYYYGGDKPYTISSADDRLIKIWDYQNKTCVQTLEGNASSVSAVWLSIRSCPSSLPALRTKLFGSGIQTNTD